MDLATSSNLKGYYEGKSGDARLMEPWLALCSLPEGHPLLTMLTYPNESVSEPSDMHQFRTQGSILIMISKGMIRKVDQPDLCVTISVAFRTIMNVFIKELRLFLVPLVHDLAWGSTV